MDLINNIDVKNFLEDYKAESQTILLEEGKEKDEIVKIAEARGILLKNSTDLAGFKTIYTFADEANKNKARLPKEKLLKSLPTLIGKPVDIDHIRRYVIGHYIDFRYKTKENMVVAYGVFYKSNFADEWKKAQELFKSGKLTTSYEIWCPKGKRKTREDGTYDLLQMEIAGGALLFKEAPAFEDAKVLELAKERLNSINYEADLVYASEDIINSSEIVDRSLVQEATKIKCSNCEHEFESYTLDSTKCPKCFAILDKNGLMINPPQIIDFKLSCPECRINNWLLLKKKENTNDIKCTNCAKEYKITFATVIGDKDLDKFSFVYSGKTACLQCGRSLDFTQISSIKEREIKCPSCQLTFNVNTLTEHNKRITKIEELKTRLEKSAEQGGEYMDKLKLVVSKFHRSIEIEKFEDFEETLPKDYDIVEEGKEPIVAKQLTPEERKALSDNMFGLVVRVLNNKTGKRRKVRMFPVNDENHVINSLKTLETEERKEALGRLGVPIEKVEKKILKRAKTLEMQDLLDTYKKVEASVELVEKSPVTLIEEVLVAGDIANAVTVPTEVSKVELTREEILIAGIKKLAKRVITLEQSKKDHDVTMYNYDNAVENYEIELAGAKEEKDIVLAEANKKVDFYKDNASKLYERKSELGEFGTELSEEDLLNDDKFEIAKLKKENSELAGKDIETASENVGSKPVTEADYAKRRQTIDEIAGLAKKQK